MLAFITCGGVSRIPRTSNGENENDTGHSWSLEALAIEYLTKLYPEEGLDKSLVRAFSHVHDLVEIETQDVNTFSLTAEQLAKKQEAERQALEEILKELPSEMSRLLEQYERQDTREALFVRAVDKILPTFISCVAGEQGVRVIEEACKVTCIEDLRAAHDHRLQMFKENFGKYFPELVDQYKYVLVRFELEYLRIKQMDNAPASSSSPEQSTQPKEEVSRRYCIDPEKLPLGDPMKFQNEDIRQGYLGVDEDGSASYVRSAVSGDRQRFELIVKSADSKVQISQISRELFKSLWPGTESRRIEITRYYIESTRHHTIYLDVYHGPLEGLHIAEVEFPGRPTEAKLQKRTFTPPEWFGPDISEDPDYDNKNLALALRQT